MRRLKDKFYRSVVRLTRLYGSECRADDRNIEQSISVVEMRMFRGRSGMTRKDRIKKKYIRQYWCGYDSRQDKGKQTDIVLGMLGNKSSKSGYDNEH